MLEISWRSAHLKDFLARTCIISAMVGLLISGSIIYYSYSYAIIHDSSIIGFFHYLRQKDYRLLQFAVSLFPIGIGYYYGRLKEELCESRKNAELLRSLIANEQKINAEEVNDSDLDMLLTSREKEVLSLIAVGMSNKQIAAKLFISDKTVKTHLRNIYKKLDINDRTSAAVLALKEGIVK